MWLAIEYTGTWSTCKHRMSFNCSLYNHVLNMLKVEVYGVSNHFYHLNGAERITPWPTWTVSMTQWLVCWISYQNVVIRILPAARSNLAVNFISSSFHQIGC